jgi:hypothetical protein
MQLTIRLVEKLREIAGRKIRFSPVPSKAYPGTSLYLDAKHYALKKNVDIDRGDVFDLTTLIDSEYTATQLDALKKRTRYNAMHVSHEGSPMSLCELSSSASTEDMLKTLCSLILI